MGPLFKPVIIQPLATRDLKTRGRRRRRKSCLKSEFAFIQSSSRLFYLTTFVKCRRILHELNSKEQYPSSEREENIDIACLRPP